MLWPSLILFRAEVGLLEKLIINTILSPVNIIAETVHQHVFSELSLATFDKLKQLSHCALIMFVKQWFPNDCAIYIAYHFHIVIEHLFKVLEVGCCIVAEQKVDRLENVDGSFLFVRAHDLYHIINVSPVSIIIDD